MPSFKKKKDVKKKKTKGLVLVGRGKNKHFQLNGVDLRGLHPFLMRYIYEPARQKKETEEEEERLSPIQAPLATCSREQLMTAKDKRKKDATKRGIEFHTKMERMITNKTAKGTIRKRAVSLGPLEIAGQKCLEMSGFGNTYKAEIGVVWQSARISTRIDRVALDREKKGYVPIEFKTVSTFADYQKHRYQFRELFKSRINNHKLKQSLPTRITGSDLFFLQNLANGILFRHSFGDSKPISDSIVLQVSKKDCSARIYRMPLWISELAPVIQHFMISTK